MKKALATSALGLFALGAHAQSSVTLYGIVDTGIGYQSSSAGARLEFGRPLGCEDEQRHLGG
ncbi:putative porin [Paraburkholderia graminis]|uniref:Porin n=1 Tax=Paraburkholderia graminis TaxID=60548 RepID=A0ABD5CGR3_9BURK|nr:putative porin [Paraburkholderia graminis]